LKYIILQNRSDMIVREYAREPTDSLEELLCETFSSCKLCEHDGETHKGSEKQTPLVYSDLSQYTW
jgi:hypothetical protein